MEMKVSILLGELCVCLISAGQCVCSARYVHLEMITVTTSELCVFCRVSNVVPVGHQ